MKTLPLKVLLLGWDQMLTVDAPPHPDALTLARSLTPALDLAVLLPHLPEPFEPVAHTQVTGLGNLNPQQLATTQRLPGTWQAPAAPYAGAEAPPPAATPAPPAGATAGNLTVTAAGPRPQPVPSAPVDLPSPAEAVSSGFADAGAEPGLSEARDLSQAADDLILPTVSTLAPVVPPSAPTAEATAEAVPPTVRALAALRAETADEADLNFRIIQYARFAAPEAAGQRFAVIYAADWPVWLAALEIRQQTGRPLVLHVHSLAADRNTPADRGWALELERLTLRRADLVLAASPAVADRLKALYNLGPDRCQVVDPNDSQALNEVLTRFTPAD